jgi:L-threonylcarbamoyladenylate synthase
MTKILNALSDSQLPHFLQNGAVGILPTDTVYGLVCRAADQTAAKRLYKLKSRAGKPGTVIAADIGQLADLGIKARYLKAVEQFWPNAISIIIPAGPELQYLHQGKLGLACRVIAQPAALRDLLQKTGPVLTSSANPPGKTPASTIKQAQTYFDGKIDFYVDGGDLSGQKPSTLIRVIDDAIEVLREGAVNIDEAGHITP